jgi:RNA polymerase sigma-70 factor (ECF subfamily)
VDQPDSAVIAASREVPEVFGILFDRHAAALLRFLARRLDPGDAEDLLGEVYRIAFERRAGYDLERPSARPWLYGIAANLVARSGRDTARRLRATAAAAARPDYGEDPADRAVSAADAAARWARVAAAVDQLPGPERDVLLLFAWEELSYEEIAAALEIPAGTVRSRLSRARARLRAVTGDADDPGRLTEASAPGRPGHDRRP